MARKGLLAVLLAAGAAVSFCFLQTVMLSSGLGANYSSSAGPAPACVCDPGLRLPVSLEAMHGIDAAVAVTVAAAWAPASRLIDGMPFIHRRLVRNLATSAFHFGMLVAFPALPMCPEAAAATSAGGAAGSSWWAAAACGECFPVSRATLRRVNAVAVAALAVACVSVYINLTYLEPDDDMAFGGAPRRPRRN
ncbi:unnamed protein product [Urochloa humidicola]